MVARGHEVKVLLSKPRPVAGAYTVDGVKVIPFKSRRDPFDYFPEADIIFTHLETTDRSVGLCAGLKKPLVQMIHNNSKYSQGYLGMGCALAVYNTHWVAEDIEAYRGSPVIEVASPGQISFRTREVYEWPSAVVHPAIDPSRYVSDGPHDMVTLINLWDGDGVKTGKGPGIFYHLAEQNPTKPFLAVKGGYGDQDIRTLPNVEFVENTDDMSTVYSRTKVLLMPSRYESFGRVAIEAAASGIPTIANPTPGLVEALGPGGLYAELDDLSRWNLLLNLCWSQYHDHIDDYAAYARDRSAYWRTTTLRELDELCLLTEAVVEEWRDQNGIH